MQSYHWHNSHNLIAKYIKIFSFASKISTLDYKFNSYNISIDKKNLLTLIWPIMQPNIIMTSSRSKAHPSNARFNAHYAEIRYLHGSL